MRPTLSKAFDENGSPDANLPLSARQKKSVSNLSPKQFTPLKLFDT